MIIGMDKKLKKVNKAALELFKVKEEDIIGKICHEHICPTEIDNCPVIDEGNIIDNSERIILEERMIRVQEELEEEKRLK